MENTNDDEMKITEQHEEEDDEEVSNSTESSPAVTGKGRVRGPWTPEEDAILTDVVSKFGARNWSLVARGIPGRSGKSCRLRWCNQLDPCLKKKPFTDEEDRIIISAHAIHGNKWAAIARLLPGRTDNAIKNHWNSTLRRRNLKQGRIRPGQRLAIKDVRQGKTKASSEETPSPTETNSPLPLDGRDVAMEGQPCQQLDKAQIDDIPQANRVQHAAELPVQLTVTRPLDVPQTNMVQYVAQPIVKPAVPHPDNIQRADMIHPPVELAFRRIAPRPSNVPQANMVQYAAEPVIQPVITLANGIPQENMVCYAAEPLVRPTVPRPKARISAFSAYTSSGLGIGSGFLRTSPTQDPVVQASKTDFGICKFLEDVRLDPIIPLHCGHGCCQTLSRSESQSSLLGPEFVDYEDPPSLPSQELISIATDLNNIAWIKSGLENNTSAISGNASRHIMSQGVTVASQMGMPEHNLRNGHMPCDEGRNNLMTQMPAQPFGAFRTQVESLS